LWTITLLYAPRSESKPKMLFWTAKLGTFSRTKCSTLDSKGRCHAQIVHGAAHAHCARRAATYAAPSWAEPCRCCPLAAAFLLPCTLSLAPLRSKACPPWPSPCSSSLSPLFLTTEHSPSFQPSPSSCPLCTLPFAALALSSSLSQLIAAVFAMDAIAVASRATRCPAISAAALSCGPS
jgi:hypothetical protein